MTHLYNCHTDGDQYRITKFDPLGNVESSYLCTTDECECPAGVRPSCRHRQMLPKFLARNAVDSYFFYDFERNGWVTNQTSYNGVPIREYEELAPEGLSVQSENLPDGVQVFGMSDLLGIHNAIADAVGEPEAQIEPAPLRRRV